MKKIYMIATTMFLLGVLSISSSAMKSNSCSNLERLQGAPDRTSVIKLSKMAKACSMAEFEEILTGMENESGEKENVKKITL